MGRGQGDQTLPRRLRLLRASLSLAPGAVANENILGPDLYTAPRHSGVEILRVLPDPSEIMHNAMGYRGPAAARPSGRSGHPPVAGFPLPASSASSSASRRARAFSTIRQEMIEASKRMIRGTARLVWLTTSGGVSTAATTNMMTIA